MYGLDRSKFSHNCGSKFCGRYTAEKNNAITHKILCLYEFNVYR